jgi:protein-tyrosine phosphatase
VIFDRLRGFNGPDREAVTERLYAQLPILLREEYKAVFRALLAHEVPLVVSDSDGQDRTGIAAALILSALGTPREAIDRDYLLSIEDRRPANEMADVDLQRFASTNSEARFLIAYRTYAEKTRDSPRTRPSGPQPLPLRDSKGAPLLELALERIGTDYGSVANYLERELGVSAKDIAKLRALYLE